MKTAYLSLIALSLNVVSAAELVPPSDDSPGSPTAPLLRSRSFPQGRTAATDELAQKAAQEFEKVPYVSETDKDDKGSK
jgi:hypothetical protein